MSMREFPVKSSPPATTTMMSPAAKSAPARAFATPADSTVWTATQDPAAPNAMKAPAITLKISWFVTDISAFRCPTPTTSSATSAGLKKLLCIQKSLPSPSKLTD